MPLTPNPQARCHAFTLAVQPNIAEFSTFWIQLHPQKMASFCKRVWEDYEQTGNRALLKTQLGESPQRFQWISQRVSDEDDVSIFKTYLVVEKEGICFEARIRLRYSGETQTVRTEMLPRATLAATSI